MATNAVVKTRIIKIGNSRGLRLPKVWLDQLGFDAEVQVAVQSDQLVIRSARHPRHDWDEQFRAMARHGDDRLLDKATPTQWDTDEWKW